MVSAALPAPALADYSIIPLPVYATSRNSGDDMGFMPVLLLKEQNEYVYGIVAPSVIYNRNSGYNITFRYLGFPSIEKNYRIFINRSTGIDQEYTGEYWDTKFLGGKCRLYTKATFFSDSTYRFFGLTERSRDKKETNYTDTEFAPEVNLGYYLPNHFVVSLGERFRWVDINRGRAGSLPFTGSRFPKLQGIKGGSVLAHRLSLSYDTRDDEVYPSAGVFANVYGELGSEFSEGRFFSKTGFEAKKYISFKDKRFTTVVKTSFQLTAGNKVPFYEESWIGGENTLRGLGNFRFRDDAYILFNVEERIRLFKMHIFDVTSDWELAPFVDTGRVFSSFRKEFTGHWQVNPGVGFRAIVPPNIVGRVDFGFGIEGLNAFVGLDFPF